jgi:hypothetical protein
MNTHKASLRIFTLASLLAILIFATAIHAQDGGYTPDDAIAFVAALPEVAQGLESTEGWTAQAYYTMNRYGVWHVQFWNADGDEIVTADVNLEDGRVFTLDAYLYPSQSVLDAAQDTVFDFLRNQPEFQEMVENPWETVMYIDFNPWLDNGIWTVWIENGDDPLYAWIAADESSAFSTNNLELIRVGFADLMSWEDWQNANTASAAAIAFRQADIANRMRDLPGWQSHAEPVNGGGDGIWWVGFYSDDWLAADATINLTTGEILSYTTY